MLGKNGKVQTRSVPCRAERKRLAGPDSHSSLYGKSHNGGHELHPILPEEPMPAPRTRTLQLIMQIGYRIISMQPAEWGNLATAFAHQNQLLRCDSNLIIGVILSSCIQKRRSTGG